MHLSRNVFLSIFLSLFVSFLYASFVAVFLKVFNAQGFNAILLIWAFVVSMLIFANEICSRRDSRLRKNDKSLCKNDRSLGKNDKENVMLNLIEHLLYIVLKVLLILAISLGFLAFLVQLSVTQRSLAQAWLESTRSGSPFGFFSFFACEIYTILLLPFVYFISKKKYLVSLLVLLSVNILCYAIIYNKQVLFALAILIAIIPCFTKGNWKRLFLPLLCSGLLSLFCTYSCVNRNITSSMVNIDLSNVMTKIAPDFPLMSHIPGYGFSLGVSKPKNVVVLSPRTIYMVEGRPNDVLYFEENRFKTWDGSNWSTLHRSGFNNLSKVDFTDSFEYSQIKEKKDIKIVKLKLQEDFYTTLPLLQNTKQVFLDKEYKNANCTFMDSNCLTVIPSLIKDTKITLVNDMNIYDTQSFSTNESKISPKIKAFAKKLCTQIDKNIIEVDDVLVLDEIQQSEYIQMVLNYFKKDFIYSLKSPNATEGTDPYEYFLFTSKTGFCTWFSGAFSLLMQCTNIPCRIVEGYRTKLDEKGLGTIAGYNGHAWNEVYLDGKWQVVEATVVFNTENPFDYLLQDDSQTKKLLENVLQEQENKEKALNQKKLNIDFWKVLLISLIILFFVIVALIIIQYKNIKVKGRFYVRHYYKKGIQSPKKIGWLLWKEQVIDYSNKNKAMEQKRSKKALELANILMKETYER